MAAIDPEVIKIEIEQNRQELNRLGECLGALHLDDLSEVKADSIEDFISTFEE